MMPCLTIIAQYASCNLQQAGNRSHFVKQTLFQCGSEKT